MGVFPSVDQVIEIIERQSEVDCLYRQYSPRQMSEQERAEEKARLATEDDYERARQSIKETLARTRMENQAKARKTAPIEP